MSMVLQCLLENKVFIKAEKCKLHHLSPFLGFIVQQGQLSQDPAKVSADAE